MVRTQLTLKWHFDTIFKFISDKLFQVSMKMMKQSVGALGELLINCVFVATSWDGF